MANWLLDYIEMTEYIPVEFRDQSFAMRLLDLKVSIAMQELEQEILNFFSTIDNFTPEEKQEKYSELLKKCDEATQAATDKVKMADRLHDLVEKSMRLLDQGLDKLKEDLIEGDKAYIVEDIERRSKELDEQSRLEHEAMLSKQRQSHTNANNSKISKEHKTNHSKNHPSHHSNGHNNHHHLQVAHHNSSNHNHNTTPGYINGNNHQRNRNNSTGTAATNLAGRQKKRERKRLNSAMTIFNRNSRTDDDSTNQSYLSSPSTPDYLVGLQQSATASLGSLTANSGGDGFRGIVSNPSNKTMGPTEKMNGSETLAKAKAKQPILTAIDAAHAVSPGATNSDRLVLFPNNNSASDNSTQHTTNDRRNPSTTTTPTTKSINSTNLLNHNLYNSQLSQLSNHLLSSLDNKTIHLNSGHQKNILNNTSSSNSMLTQQKGDNLTHHQNHLNHNNHQYNNHQVSNDKASSLGPFSALPLSSQNDPIMMAASQAINATQNMAPGRRTSSLKASYAAVNSGRLHPKGSSDMLDGGSFFEHGNTMTPGEVYCKCRGAIHDTNMIACDNDDCKYEWFHYECVGITTPPEGEWYCDDCKILLRSQNYLNKLQSITAKPQATATPANHSNTANSDFSMK